MFLFLSGHSIFDTTFVNFYNKNILSKLARHFGSPTFVNFINIYISKYADLCPYILVLTF